MGASDDETVDGLQGNAQPLIGKVPSRSRLGLRVHLFAIIIRIGVVFATVGQGGVGGRARYENQKRISLVSLLS